MRGTGTVLFGGLALILSTSLAGAAELRVLSVGSVQIAAKVLAQDFTKATGHQVMLTIVAPSEIRDRLASAPYDMVICSVPAMAGTWLSVISGWYPSSRRGHSFRTRTSGPGSGGTVSQRGTKQSSRGRVRHNRISCAFRTIQRIQQS